MAGKAFQDATDAGLRIYHYGTTVNNPIGRAYFGLLDAFSFLIETRGIGAGKTNFERRVFSQQTVIMSYIKSTAENAEEIKEIVAAARAETIAKGATYDESDLLYLYQTKSGNTQTPYAVARHKFMMDGTEVIGEPVTLSLNDTGARTRVRPTAYVVPADMENIDKVLYIMDNQGAEYYTLDAGSSAVLEQYYYISNTEAALREATTVTFENGAYVIPMDQFAADVIAMTFEPDVRDSNGYDGTLFQYGVVTYDAETKNFPYFRYTGNDPRENLVSNASSGGSSSGGGSSTPVDPPYNDVTENDWFFDDIKDAKNDGLLDGIAGDLFDPYSDTTRGTFVTVLWNKEGKPQSAEGKYFPDVDPMAYYANAVKWASANRIVNGYDNGKYGPEDLVTREQMAVILYQYAQFKGYDVTATTTLDDKFSDAAKVSSWAAKHMKWAVAVGLFEGRDNGQLDPRATATRAEMIIVINQFIEKFEG